MQCSPTNGLKRHAHFQMRMKLSPCVERQCVVSFGRRTIFWCCFTLTCDSVFIYKLQLNIHNTSWCVNIFSAAVPFYSGNVLTCMLYIYILVVKVILCISLKGTSLGYWSPLADSALTILLILYHKNDTILNRNMLPLGNVFAANYMLLHQHTLNIQL